MHAWDLFIHAKTALQWHTPILLLQFLAGCGKSTQVPQYILEAAIADGWGADCNIICTQPRRVSAVGLATRVAQVRYVYPLQCCLGTMLHFACPGGADLLPCNMPRHLANMCQALLHQPPQGCLGCVGPAGADHTLPENNSACRSGEKRLGKQLGTASGWIAGLRRTPDSCSAPLVRVGMLVGRQGFLMELMLASGKAANAPDHLCGS